jgi:low affinity Fe/Cu permease
MKESLLNFYNRNKKLVIILSVSVVVLIFVVLYFNYSSLLLNCKFENGNYFDQQYRERIDIKSNEIWARDKIISINLLTKKITVDDNKEYFDEKSADGSMNTYVDIKSNLIKWYKFNKVVGEENYELNRLSGRLDYRQHRRDMDLRGNYSNNGYTVTTVFQCRKLSNSF